MVSRKKVQAHISSKLYLKHLDLDVFTQDGVLRIVGRNGIDKTFATDRAAKLWATKLDNQEQCRRANARAWLIDKSCL
jgi:hypothetical protein